MNKPINERFVFISTKQLKVPFDITQDDDVEMTLSYKGQIKHYILNAVSQKFNSNQDGTDDKISTLKSLEE